ncbi:efflux transporter outer membrane subunit [Thermodesulfobacterium sp. TA1]|uniref:efflux transporter outer membrane subunit n=1 Tax=Thermodesulfobacterium sp. TA1 TaxID=2234087 RepID=UPI0012327905|nr:efflux transporter outer membrane subunit [Thermodesulfobacterium sp. TA1]QER42255.1 efflux transporter outer membrane subunit [Thermodesulfobacterium sp. TA1]
MRKTKLISLGLSTVIFFGCSLAPELKKPEIPLPQSLRLENSTAILTDRWWQNFNDPYLNQLVEEALKENDDLLIAQARVEQALATLGGLKAQLYPYVGYQGSAQRGRTSEYSSPYGGQTDYLFSLSGLVSYELDLWGKLRNQEKAGLARLLSSKANQEALKISLISNVVSTYLNLISVNLQLKTAEEYTEKLRETYLYRQTQFQHGLVNELVVEQAKAEYESARLRVETLKNRRETLKTALSLLLGRTPKEIFEKDLLVQRELPLPLKPPSVLPSELLTRRPDIIAAEEALKAVNFEIGVAKAAYFPSISLTGALGYKSNELANLITHSASFWSLGASLVGPILDFGRTKSQIELKEAQKKEALYNYLKTVKTAFKEVYDALAAVEAAEKKLEAQKEQIASLEKVLTLSEKKFEQGLVDYLVVIDAQRSHLNAKLNLIQLQTDLLNAYVSLYKALGGGYSNRSTKE